MVRQQATIEQASPHSSTAESRADRRTACGKKDDSTTATDATVGATETTAATGDTQGTVAADTSVAETTPPETTPAQKPVPGGEITVSGEAEVANAWIPAAMQCDTYCHQRARTFFEPIASFGVDNKVHPFLAESITPNADATEWTITVRPGISFTDGTPLNADAMIENLQRTGTYILIAAQVADLAKVDDPGGATNADGSPKKVLKIEKADDMTFTIFTGKDGDPAQAAAMAGLRRHPHQPVRSDRFADVVAGGRRRCDQGVSAHRNRAVHRRELRAARRPGRHEEPELLAQGRRRRAASVPRQDHVQGDRGCQDRRRQHCAVATSTSSPSPVPR